MKVCNWDKWQTFRKDRGAPPWIKVHRNLMSNEEWAELTDSEKGQLISIWILAADKNGVIPDSSKMIQRMAMLDSKPNINKFIELGFLSTTCQPDDNQGIKPQQQSDAPEESRGEERRVEESREINTMSNENNFLNSQAQDIFEFWCTTMKKGKSAFSVERKNKVLARLKEGYTVQDIKTAITNCSNTPHNMGQNSNGKKYNDLELICRNTTKLEGFRDNPGNLNTSTYGMSEKTQQNVDSFKQFIENNQGPENEHS